jgi:hypothetical protein
MIISTLWGLRKGERMPELMEAWDEYSVDSYSDGWVKACEKAIASWGDDLVEYREINVSVDVDQIELAFYAPTVPGDVIR